MATPPSSATSPSPPMPYRNPPVAPPQVPPAALADPADREQRKIAVQKLLARAEVANVSLLLRSTRRGPRLARGVDVTGGRAARRRRIVHTASRASRAAEAPRGRVGWAGAAAPSETLSPSTLTHHSHRSLVHCGRVSPSPRTRRPTTSSMSPYANSRRRALPRGRARHSRLTAPSPQSAKP